MDTFITQTLSIKNHPISRLKEPFKLKYVFGLGEFMCYLSRKDTRAKLVFEVWARSILGQIPHSSWQVTNDLSNVKSATSLLLDGFHLFSMRRIFFWDCLYLAFVVNPKLHSIAFSFLNEHVGIIKRKALSDVYDNWNNPNYSKIPRQLLTHKMETDMFSRKPLKTILVVATMTAGKSTLLNAITGYKLNKVSATACTNKLCYIFNKPSTDGLIMKLSNGSYKYSCNINVSSEDEFSEVALHFNSILSDSKICLIDTPGVNFSRSAQQREITYKAIKGNQYDTILFVSNSNYSGTNDEIELLNFTLKNSTKPVVFVLNKVDTFSSEFDSINKAIRVFENILHQVNCYNKVIPMSAIAAYYSKQTPKSLRGEALFEYELYKNIFKNSYFDLPSYFEGVNSRGFIERTGIILLENKLKNILR